MWGLKLLPTGGCGLGVEVEPLLTGEGEATQSVKMKTAINDEIEYERITRELIFEGQYAMTPAMSFFML